VEDEFSIREGISCLIKDMEDTYELIGEAENGYEGWELIRRLKPDIVITDIRMPIMDGLEMLTKVYEEGLQTKAIVLSAYSEFEYARQAVKLGVTEYLIKPVVVNDFFKALLNAKRQVEKGYREQPEKMGTLEQIFAGILWGGLEPDDSVIDYVSRRFVIEQKTPVIQICIYLGSSYENQLEMVKRNLKMVLSQKQDILSCILDSPYEKTVLVILLGVEDGRGLERWFQYHILRETICTDRHVGIGWIETKGIATIKQGFETLYPYLDWNIVLGDDVIISYPGITQIHTVPCRYPVELENQLKVAICEHDQNKIRKYLKKFGEYFQQGKLYSPQEIKECYVRFLWTLINIAKEVGIMEAEGLEQRKLLELIMNAKTCRELENAQNYVVDQLKVKGETEEEVVHLAVKRAKSMIKEFYQNGITLDEIASKLNITPEYLGTQFHKEVGVNFSTYIRDFRINKAKVLLIGTQMKMYEIAEQVGYANNPKYFSRMFKEHVGQLPDEFRKAHK